MGQLQRPIAVQYVQRQKEHHAAGQLNVWLERCDDSDSGPLDEAIDRQLVPGAPRVLRETAALYGQEWNDEDAPF